MNTNGEVDRQIIKACKAAIEAYELCNEYSLNLSAAEHRRGTFETPSLKMWEAGRDHYSHRYQDAVQKLGELVPVRSAAA